MKKVIKKTTPVSKSTKIGTSNIQKLIKEEAQVIKRKREIYEQIKSFNKELGELNKKGLGKLGLQERVMTVGAQGFGAAPGASGAQAHPTGFVYPQNISHVAELEAELAPEEEATVVLDEPGNKEMVDGDVKKQLIDMKEKLEMILSSLEAGTATGTEDTEADQAEAQTETPEETEDEDDADEEETDETEGEDDKDEEEEIVIKENKNTKKFTAMLNHDKGKTKISTTASDKDAAIKKLMDAEDVLKVLLLTLKK